MKHVTRDYSMSSSRVDGSGQEGSFRSKESPHSRTYQELPVSHTNDRIGGCVSPSVRRRQWSRMDRGIFDQRQTGRARLVHFFTFSCRLAIAASPSPRTSTATNHAAASAGRRPADACAKRTRRAAQLVHPLISDVPMKKTSKPVRSMTKPKAPARKLPGSAQSEVISAYWLAANSVDASEDM